MINNSLSFMEARRETSRNYQHILIIFKKKKTYLQIFISSAVFAHLIFQQETLGHLHMKQR